jgi:hypothetical protein
MQDNFQHHGRACACLVKHTRLPVKLVQGKLQAQPGAAPARSQRTDRISLGCNWDGVRALCASSHCQHCRCIANMTPQHWTHTCNMTTQHWTHTCNACKLCGSWLTQAMHAWILEQNQQAQDSTRQLPRHTNACSCDASLSVQRPYVVCPVQIQCSSHGSVTQCSCSSSRPGTDDDTDMHVH